MHYSMKILKIYLPVEWLQQHWILSIGKMRDLGVVTWSFLIILKEVLIRKYSEDNDSKYKKQLIQVAFVVLPVQFSNLFIEDLRKLANMAA